MTGAPWGVQEGQASLAGADAGRRAVAVLGLGTSDGSAQVTVAKVVAGGGLVFRYRDAFNYWALTAAPKFGTWNIQKIVDGQTINLGNVGRAPVVDNTTISAKFQGDHISFQVNGADVKSLDDPTFATERFVGMVGVADDEHAVRFDNFVGNVTRAQTSASSPASDVGEHAAWTHRRKRRRAHSERKWAQRQQASVRVPGRLSGLAAMTVLVYHVMGRLSFHVTHPTLGAYTARLGNYGVTIFFLLSGFLLYRPFVVAHFENTESPSWPVFYVRRLARIIPAYWVALTFLFLVFHYSHLNNVGDALTYYGFAQIYRPVATLGALGQAWSLCVEMTFYLFLPVLAFALAQLRFGEDELKAKLYGQLVGLSLMFAFSVGYKMWAVPEQNKYPLAGLWLPARLDLFALGMLLAVASAWMATGGRLPALAERFTRSPLLCLLFAAEFYWMFSQLNLPRLYEDETLSQTLLPLPVRRVVSILPPDTGDPRGRDPRSGGRVLQERADGVAWDGFVRHLSLAHDVGRARLAAGRQRPAVEKCLGAAAFRHHDDAGVGGLELLARRATAPRSRPLAGHARSSGEIASARGRGDLGRYRTTSTTVLRSRSK